MGDSADRSNDPMAGLDPEVVAYLHGTTGEPEALPATPATRATAAGSTQAGSPGATAAPGTPVGSGHANGPGQRAGRSAVGAAGVMLVVLVAAALLDPSGLLAPVAWTGARPAVEPWTWLPYALQAPLIVLGAWLATRTLLRGASPAAPRRWVLTRVWAVVVLALMAAKLVYSIVFMSPALIDGVQAGLRPAPALAFVVWSTGFAGVKGLVLGWLPGMAAALLWAPGGARRAGAAARAGQPTRVAVPAAAVALGLVVAGGWLAQSWWTGSPVGYAYAEGWRLLAPTPAAGVGGQLAALLVVVLAVARSGHRTLRVVPGPRPAGTRLVAGAIAALAAGVVLALAGSALHLAFGTDVPGGDDVWIVPASYLRLVEGLSFGLLLAPVAAIGFWLMPRTPRPDRSWVFAVAAVVLGVGSVVLLVRQDPGDPGVPPLADADAPPVGLPDQREPDPGQPLPLSPVTVRRDADGVAVLADQFGAQVIPRGVNVNQLVQYDAPDPQLPTVLPLSEQDFADIAAMGFNTVRLALSWSALEPEPGRIDPVEIGRIRQAVDWAGQHGIRVVLDLHQDAWGMQVGAPPGTVCRANSSAMSGWDGAPGWASYFDAAPPCQFTDPDLAPNVLRAFTSFYTDRAAVAESLIRLWGRLADEFAADPTVLGYDLFNEPGVGEHPPLTSGALLGRYHSRAIAAIRAAEQAAPGGYPHPVFVEPSRWWSAFAVDPLPPHGYTSDPQVVFAPHEHGPEPVVELWGRPLVGMERGLALAQRAADRWGAPLWVAQRAWPDDPSAGAQHLERFAAAEDRLLIGSAPWVWKVACGDPHSYPARVVGTIRRTACPQGTQTPIQAERIAPLRRAYPRSAPGRIRIIDAEGRRLRLDGTTEGAGPVDGVVQACSLDVWVPGATEPRVLDSVGLDRLRLVQVPAGSAVQAPSGGWRVIGCATGGEYRLTLF